MTMLEKVKAAIAEQYAPAINHNAPYAKVMLDIAAKAAINALREPDAIDPKILMAMDHYLHVNYNKMWDAALDQIIDPD